MNPLFYFHGRPGTESYQMVSMEISLHAVSVRKKLATSGEGGGFILGVDARIRIVRHGLSWGGLCCEQGEFKDDY